MSTCLPVEPRRRGRPRRQTPASALCVRLSARMHDALIRMASLRGVSVSAAVRRAIGRELLYLKKSRRESECYGGDAHDTAHNDDHAQPARS